MRPFVLSWFVCLLLSPELFAQDPTPPESCSASAPSVTSLSPSSGPTGSRVTITGTNFGSEKGSSKVTLDGKTAQTTDWNCTSITALIPPGAKTGKVVVTLAVKGAPKGKDSLASTATPSGVDQFTVDAPEYDHSAFEVLTGVGAVLAGAEATSYKTDNDALSATNVGRKTPEILLGGGFILPWRRGGGWIERSYCGPKLQKKGVKDPSDDCTTGGAYHDYRPWETFLSIRFAPANDQTINGFVIGAGYRITKYFSLMMGYSITPVQEPSPGFRVAAAKIVTDNPTIAPYDRYNSAALLSDKPGAFDGFPLFVYNASGVTTTKLFPSSPTVTHHRSGIYFGVGIPLNLTSLFKPAAGK